MTIVQFKSGTVASANSLAVTLDSPVTAGNSLVIISAFVGNSIGTITAADSLGNVWANNATSTGFYLTYNLRKAPITVPGTNTVTLSVTGSAVPISCTVYEVSGLLGFLNTHATLTVTPTFTYDGGTTGPFVGGPAALVLLAAMDPSFANSTFTATAGYTVDDTVGNVTAVTTWVAAHQIFASTSNPVSFSGSFTASNSSPINTLGIIAAYFPAVAALSIACGSPPAGTVGVFYSHAFPASGGTPAYTFSVLSGVLPTGVTLDASTGIASGVPTVAATFTPTIQVEDSTTATANTGPCSITIATAPPPPTPITPIRGRVTAVIEQLRLESIERVRNSKTIFGNPLANDLQKILQAINELFKKVDKPAIPVVTPVSPESNSDLALQAFFLAGSGSSSSSGSGVIVRLFSSAITAVAGTPLAVVHGLASLNVQVSARDNSTPPIDTGISNIEFTNANTVTVTFGIGFTGTIVVIGG